MARVTVEDCVDKVPNRFDLVMLAAHRAREIASGSPVTVERDNDKNPVVSLREIADETQMVDDLLERLIESNQTQIEVDEPEEDSMALLMGGEPDKPAEDDLNDKKIAACFDGSSRPTVRKCRHDQSRRPDRSDPRL